MRGRDYARRGIEPVKRKGLIDLIANIGFKGTRKQARDTLGRVYECLELEQNQSRSTNSRSLAAV